MKTTKTQLIDFLRHQRWGLILLTAILFYGCEKEESIEYEESNFETFNIKSIKNTVSISSSGFDFEAPDQIPSGWTTFEYQNNAHHPHFFILEKMPEGFDVNNSINEVVPLFQEGMDFIIDGDFDSALAAFGNLPAWYFQVVIVGGPGMVSAGESAISTVNLEPGTYVIECYVKLPDGTFHTTLGMIDQIIVTEESNNNVVPKADVNINVSSTSGIEILNTIKPGLRTFEVNFEDQIVHEHFLGHDVQLVKLEDTADISSLNAWMNWSAPLGLTGHGVDGVTFIGGTQEAPAGDTTYFTALLKPGNYALIAEVPDPMSKGMLQTFTVPSN
ncbi:hypothetical protein [Winogradskyella sp. A3E31]|uniref:hypothetical protein n=1 Tax=Winogradskyella sp. A3E31 TaxID=3349637 RepID=UPI00398AF539